MNEATVSVGLGEPPQWDEAFRRVESYLCAHGVESRLQLNSLATAIIGEAQQRAPNHPAADPVTLAMEVADERIGAWLRNFFEKGNFANDRFQARGRLAMILANVPGRWSQHFLAGEPAPAELVTAMREGDVQAGPAVRFTNMAPSPIEFPLAETAKRAEAAYRRGTVVRAVAMWVTIIGLLGVTWAASH